MFFNITLRTLGMSLVNVVVQSPMLILSSAKNANLTRLKKSSCIFTNVDFLAFGITKNSSSLWRIKVFLFYELWKQLALFRASGRPHS